MKQKRTTRRLLAVLLTLLLAAALAACGSNRSDETGDAGSSDSGEKASQTKIEKAFAGINPRSGMHMKAVMTADQQDVDLDMYRKGEKLRLEMTVDGSRLVYIDDDRSEYILTPDLKQAMRTDEGSREMELAEDFYSELADIIDENTLTAQVTEGTRTIGGTEYDTETVKDDDETMTFCFEGEKLRRILLKDEHGSMTVKVKSLDSTVPKDSFTVPSDYQIVNGQGEEAEDDYDGD
ncbi:MAG: hypothetical protein ACOX41_07570 [Anaerovoracaceae bacterium]